MNLAQSVLCQPCGELRQPQRAIFAGSMTSRVLKAIKDGCETNDAILNATGLLPTQIRNALGSLCADKKVTRTGVGSEWRWRAEK